MKSILTFLVFIVFACCLGLINASQFFSCTDSYSGDGYYNEGGAVGYNLTLNNFCNQSNDYCERHFVDHLNGFWGTLDYCDGDYIMEAYCKGNAGEHLAQGGVLAYDKHLCENGCEETKLDGGYCVSSPKVCADLNQTIKDKIIELQKTGEYINFIEGNGRMFEGDYVVVSQNGFSKILKIESVRRNSTSTWVYFEDAVNNENINFIFNKSQLDERVILSIDGQTYYSYIDADYVGKDYTPSLLLAWGNKAVDDLSARGVGAEAIISCPHGCENGICLSCIENWQCNPWANCTENKQTRNCTDLNQCETFINKPSESKECEKECTEDWSCNDWSLCKNKIKYRDCKDKHDCGTYEEKLATSQICTQEEIENSEQKTNSGLLINNISVIIEKDSEGFDVLKVENSSVMSSLSIINESQNIYAISVNGNRQVKILPMDAVAKSGLAGENVETIRIDGYNGEAVYSISGFNRAKLFFIIPVHIKIEDKINVETGESVFFKKSWWSFLVLGE